MTRPNRYWSSRKGEGEAIRWLRDHVDYDKDYCLIWPLASRIRGYGHLSANGETHYAHRLMCQMAHGDPPSPLHQAAHSCGRGDQGCVNPRHLSWKTPSENQRDKRLHGTAGGDFGRKRYKLTDEQVSAIKAAQGTKTHAEFAEMYGVSRRTIGMLLTGKSWRRGGRIPLSMDPRNIRRREKTGR